MTIAKKMKKYFGENQATWWCRFGKCLYIFSVPEVKEKDEKGEIAWAKITEDEDTITPICPFHGTPLTYAEEGDTINIADGINLVM